MKTKTFFLISTCVTCFACSARKIHSPKFSDIYRDYVFYLCIQKAFPNDSAYNNDISMGVYNDFSGFSINGDIDVSLDSIATTFVNSIQPTQIADYGNKKPLFMSCLEFYKSKELDKFVKKLAKETPKF